MTAHKTGRTIVNLTTTTTATARAIAAGIAGVAAGHGDEDLSALADLLVTA